MNGPDGCSTLRTPHSGSVGRERLRWLFESGSRRGDSADRPVELDGLEIFEVRSMQLGDVHSMEQLSSGKLMRKPARKRDDHRRNGVKMFAG